MVVVGAMVDGYVLTVWSAGTGDGELGTWARGRFIQDAPSLGVSKR
jgi:hypothetical protein